MDNDTRRLVIAAGDCHYNCIDSTAVRRTFQRVDMMPGVSLELFNAAKTHYNNCCQKCDRCPFHSHESCAIVTILAIGRGQGIDVPIRGDMK